ncbi:MAG: outer membrane protein assembly factor BamD [Pseudomonadota bacterium]
MTSVKSVALIGLVALPIALTAGCSSNSRRAERAYIERPVEVLYNQAAREMDQRDYDAAIVLFNEVERQHPYSEWARRSTLMSAFAAYQSRKYDEAISTAQRYVALNPGSENAPYAYHLIATSYFEQITDVGRDQRTTELARGALDEIMRRYPTSEYARDAQLKMDMVNDQLAGKEMEIGRWYLRQNQHLPAINRFRTVVTGYDTTTHSPEALYRLVESYLSIGLRGEAQAAAAVLGYNHPETNWYQDAYRLMVREGLDPNDIPEERRRGLLSRLF